MSPNNKPIIKVVFDKEHDEVNIYANSIGLECLRTVCNRLLEKEMDHVHLASWTEDVKFIGRLQGLIIWHLNDEKLLKE